MGTRPKEIQQLVEWLREPGRVVAKGLYYDKGIPCSMGKLMDIAMTGFSWTALERCGVKEDRVDAVFGSITRLNDNKGPLAVAEYLEREFPA